ncbi:DUF4082 domain-containing protein [Planotetraspora sp. A-T 1434]|uniref:DUF4082 domain-containing protein n=1 Tax=Planotetraspora sp. A-T 1434 TaxID=2979219 RepID=UPI0021BEC02F|nr:DUF4082 domain-containing protein [Planotetraspora sp. A-T 1434]MCT9931983.1 DUF4082 domain-containing protein [Planotetraspora sp. A-T 1434]
MKVRIAVFSALFAAVFAIPVPAQAAGPCDSGGNAITCENNNPGTSPEEWDSEYEVSDGETIEGYSDQFSVAPGTTINFKIRTSATAFTVKVYRVGYYQGNGARFITDLTPNVSVARANPATCPTNDTTGLTECSWNTAASWAVPSGQISGVYFAHLVRTDGTTDGNKIVFVVRNDSSTSDLLFKTSDTTWQAYNDWGGNSFYSGTANTATGRAVKLSYNRPFHTRVGTTGRDFFFNSEYPMVRFLERNGYDVSYIGSLDAGRDGAALLNHKTLLSVGHDEYWSATERANFEAARDAGVNLAFFSGNEVFWKTRWENGANGAPYRTLVTYKETHDNAKTDPNAAWTGTWRDPRFSPPADGGRPENSLTGTLWTVNCCTYAMTVPSADGKMRLWRNSNLASRATLGLSTTLPDGTLGYEWDEDVDNGSRPAGLFHMSSTTVSVPAKVQDWGSNVAADTATHSLTMYRAPSGALVFGAGTVQWSWGLDDNHDGDTPAVDASMQQATVNLFADMGVQPKSLMSGLNSATASSDHTAPTSTIVSPVANTSLNSGTTVTISGTALDSGGGKVGGVEVSTDGGATWHPATGRETWTYSWTATGSGTVNIKTRAVDDSSNLETPGAGRNVTVNCPCTIFPNSFTPVKAAENDSSAVELGVKFRAAQNGWVTGVRFYKGTGNTGTHTGSLWKADGTLLATGTFSGETSTGWQTLTFPNAVTVSANTTYIASYYAPAGHYASTPGGFWGQAYKRAPLTALKAGDDGGNGVYRVGAGFPDSTYNGGNYGVDVVFATQDTFPPGVNSSTPFAGSSSVPVSVAPTITFNEPIQSGTANVTVKDAANNTVAGNVSLDGAATKITFTPANPLAADVKYTVSVSGAKDVPGNTMSGTYSYTFTTAKATLPPGQCPCSIWNDLTVPGTVSANDPNELELGVKFRASVDGYITGIRFYKGASNTGPHIGTLWSAGGTALASATFSNESTLGWQQVTFSSPVAVTAGTTYVASYHTTTGYYSVDNSGLSSAVTYGPLTALADGADGGNGLYAYGARRFPTGTWGASNYWVDVVFSVPPDTTAPTVQGKLPSDAATGVSTSAVVKATFSEPVQTGTPVITVEGPGNTTVSGTASLDSTRKVLTFTPGAALTAGTLYTVTVSGAKDDAGNTMSSTPWSFTTTGSCPCSIWESDTVPGVAAENDGSGIELGVKFSSDTAGQITGIRFYKGPGNTGTHIGNLWAADGTPLASGTFSGETSGGWQTLTFTSPVSISANTTYVASYYAPNGHYSADSAYFNTGPATNGHLTALANGGGAAGNGVYAYGSSSQFPNNTYNGANYWVDVVFQP